MVKFLVAKWLANFDFKFLVEFVTFTANLSVRVRPWLLENLRSSEQNPCLSELKLLLTNNKYLKTVIDRTFLFH